MLVSVVVTCLHVSKAKIYGLLPLPLVTAKHEERIPHCISLAQEKIKIQKSIISIECTLLSQYYKFKISWIESSWSQGLSVDVGINFSQDLHGMHTVNKINTGQNLAKGKKLIFFNIRTYHGILINAINCHKLLRFWSQMLLLIKLFLTDK